MLSSLEQSLRTLVRGLRAPGFYLLLAVSIAGWAVAYQYKTTYTVDVGGLRDDAYVSGFYAKEPAPSALVSGGGPGYTYRWSGARSELILPGIGNEPVQLTISTVAGRPSGETPPVTITARGQTFSLQARNDLHSDTFLVGRGDPLEGDFRITISSPTFSTPTDPRKLGIVVDRIAVAPASYGMRPPVIPPLTTMLGLLAGLIATYLASLVAVRSRATALWLVGVASVAVGIEIVFSRTELGFLAGQLPSVGGWALGLALLGRAGLEGLARPRTAAASFVVGAGAAAFVLAFVLRFAGLTYPQFLTSDIMLHVHNVQKVIQGQWVFPGFLPDGTPVPYPPAYYLILSLLSWPLGGSDEAISLLLKWSASLLDASTCLGLAWAGWRVWGGRVGGFAALAYAVSPSPYDLFSAGNYSNLFGQSVLNITLLGGLILLAARPDSRTALRAGLLAAGFGLTMLGHYGMMLGTLAILGLFGVWALATIARRRPPGNVWWLFGAAALALTLSFGLYYWRFVAEMWNQFGGIFQRLGGQRATSVQTQLPATFGKLGGKIGELVGVPAVFFAAGGAALENNVSSPAGALLFSWLAAGALFALLDQAVGDALRWYYLAAAAVSLAVGQFMSRLWARGGRARLFIRLALVAMLMQSLTYWVGNLIFTRYHLP